MRARRSISAVVDHNILVIARQPGRLRVVVRFPRISLIRWDNLSREADEHSTLENILVKA
jgi:hypothetical protein